jgi:hypothetical protein
VTSRFRSPIRSASGRSISELGFTVRTLMDEWYEGGLMLPASRSSSPWCSRPVSEFEPKPCEHPRISRGASRPPNTVSRVRRSRLATPMTTCSRRASSPRWSARFSTATGSAIRSRLGWLSFSSSRVGTTRIVFTRVSALSPIDFDRRARVATTLESIVSNRGKQTTPAPPNDQPWSNRRR